MGSRDLEPFGSSDMVSNFTDERAVAWRSGKERITQACDTFLAFPGVAWGKEMWPGQSSL